MLKEERTRNHWNKTYSGENKSHPSMDALFHQCLRCFLQQKAIIIKHARPAPTVQFSSGKLTVRARSTMVQYIQESDRERVRNVIINSSLCESVRHKRIKWLHRIIIFTASALCLRTNNGINATAANGTEIIYTQCACSSFTHISGSRCMRAVAAECDVSSARVTCATYCIVHLHCAKGYILPKPESLDIFCDWPSMQPLATHILYEPI